MTPPKIVVYGNTSISLNQLNALHSYPFDVTPVPESYPADRLEFLAPFHLVLLHTETESLESLERIRALRRRYSTVPLILTASNPSTHFLVQAFRHGITDCLLEPFNDEQLSTLLASHLKDTQPAPLSSMNLVPEMLHPASTWENPERDADLFVQFLGTMRLCYKGKRLDLPGGHRQRSLLAYLLYQGKTPVHRDRIIGYFWPDHDLDCAKNNLNVGICNLRRFLDKHIQEDVISFRNEFFTINPDLYICRDIDLFNYQFHRGKQAEQREELKEAAAWFQHAIQHGAEFLEEFRQEEWSIRPREVFMEKYFHAAELLGACQQKAKQFNAAIETYRLILFKDDCLEFVHRNIMACYLALGKKEKAVRQFHECERILREKLDIRPSPETVDLFRHAKGPVAMNTLSLRN